MSIIVVEDSGFTTGVEVIDDRVETYEILSLVGEPGPQGDPGEKGDQGIQGEQGIQGDQGVQGDKGDQGDPGADGKSFEWEGTYSGATTYQPGETIEYNGSSYICILETTGNIPTNPTYWDLMAQKGSDGSGSGTVTSVGIVGTDGVEVDSGSPVTSAGDIQLGVNVAALKTHTGFLQNLAEDTTPELGGHLSTKGQTVQIRDSGDNLRGVMGNQVTGNGWYAVYSSDGNYDPLNGGAVFNSGGLELHGAAVSVEELSHTNTSGRQVYVSESGVLFGVDPPDPGWISTATDSGSHDLGTGTGAGAWVEVTALDMNVAEAVANGDRLDGGFQLYAVNKTGNRTGEVEIGYGLNGAAPTGVAAARPISAGFDGYLSGSFTLFNVTLAQNDTLSIWARINNGSQSAFGVDLVGTTNNHTSYISVPGGGGALPPTIAYTDQSNTFTENQFVTTDPASGSVRITSSNIHIGRDRTSNGSSILDFFTDSAAPTVRTARIQRGSGANAILTIENSGTGIITLSSAGAVHAVSDLANGHYRMVSNEVFIGRQRTSDGTATFNLITDSANAFSAQARFKRNGGPNGLFTIEQFGTGDLDLITGGGDVNANGRPVQSGVWQAFDSGTWDTGTGDVTISGIPSGTQEIYFCVSGCSLASVADLTFQLGDSGGIETTGYRGNILFVSGTLQGQNASTTGLFLGHCFNNMKGYVHLKLVDPSANLWTCLGTSRNEGTDYTATHFGGQKALSAELTQLKLLGALTSTGSTYELYILQ